MSAKTVLNIGIIAIGLIISCIILGSTYNNVNSITENDINTTIPIQERSGYMLKIYNNKVGIFRTPSKTPYTYLDIDISYLNDYDRKLLLNGIEVSSEQELKSLIEDFTS